MSGNNELDEEDTNEMTINELRSIAERQRQQLARQIQQLRAKEERRTWLRSIHSQRSVQHKTLTELDESKVSPL